MFRLRAFRNVSGEAAKNDDNFGEGGILSLVGVTKMCL